MRSPSLSASDHRLSKRIPPQSPNIIPSAFTPNGWHPPCLESAPSRLNDKNDTIEFSILTPPVRTASQLPSSSAPTLIFIAARLAAHAASTVKLEPPKSKRLGIRPATTLERKPRKVLSCHSA